MENLKRLAYCGGTQGKSGRTDRRGSANHRRPERLFSPVHANREQQRGLQDEAEGFNCSFQINIVGTPTCWFAVNKKIRGGFWQYRESWGSLLEDEPLPFPEEMDNTALVQLIANPLKTGLYIMKSKRRQEFSITRLNGESFEGGSARSRKG